MDQDDQGGDYRGVVSDGTFIYVANYLGGHGIMSYSADVNGNLTFLDSDATVSQFADDVWNG